MKNLYLAIIVLTIAMLIVTPSMLSAAQANLLSNSGFETQRAGDFQDAADWTELGASGRENWAAYNGSQGMALYAWAGGTGEVYQELSVTEGFQYTYDIWAMRDGGETYNGNFYMKLAWYNGDSFISEDSQNINLAVDTWAKKSLSATAPANADTVRVIIGSSGVNVTGKFDDASLTLRQIISKNYKKKGGELG